MLKTFCLLRLENGANKSVAETTAVSIDIAVRQFNTDCFGVVESKLDDRGYLKLGQITYCVAERFEPIQT